MMKKKWIRYRFKTESIKDYRPLVFNPRYPWWCTGFSDFDAVIVAYLPKGEDLFKYWDDAFDIEKEERDEITFTDRFSKPEWFLESQLN